MGIPPQIQRSAAFADTPSGGNPAGVVLDATELSDAEMQAIDVIDEMRMPLS